MRGDEEAGAGGGGGGGGGKVKRSGRSGTAGDYGGGVTPRGERRGGNREGQFQDEMKMYQNGGQERNRRKEHSEGRGDWPQEGGGHWGSKRNPDQQWYSASRGRPSPAGGTSSRSGPEGRRAATGAREAATS